MFQIVRYNIIIYQTSDVCGIYIFFIAVTYKRVNLTNSLPAYLYMHVNVYYINI